MPGLKITAGEWVLVCDGSKALVLENVGDEKFPNLKTREVFQEPSPATHEQGTDAPGRAINSVGAARSAMGQTDWHDQGERQFLGRLAVRLEHAVSDGELKSLIVVAPPRALGMIRQAYTPLLRGVLRDEIDKDLVKLPVDQIERHLVG